MLYFKYFLLYVTHSFMSAECIFLYVSRVKLMDWHLCKGCTDFSIEGRKYTYNVTLRRMRKITAAGEKQ